MLCKIQGIALRDQWAFFTKEAARKSREKYKRIYMPGSTDKVRAGRKEHKRINALIAQSVEHAAVNRSVTGSSPVWGAMIITLQI